MIEWDAYTHRLQAHGDTVRSRMIERTAAKVREGIMTSPGCREVLVDDIPQYIYIKRTDAPTKKAFNTLPGETVSLGAVVYWENRHWLVTESLCDDNMTYYGAIELCNRQLVWQNPQTREIIKRWCTLSKPYYSNLDSGLTMTISSREFKVQLPSDYESNLIDVDKRFMLEVIGGEPKVYKCTSVDTNTERYDVDGESTGFLVLNIEQCQYDPDKDSIEYGICDYLEPFDDLVSTDKGWCIIEAPVAEIVPGGLPVTVHARFFDDHGQPMSSEQTVWTVDADPAVKAALAEHLNDDGTLRLKMDDQFELIGRDITIVASNPDGTIYNTVTLKVVNAL